MKVTPKDMEQARVLANLARTASPEVVAKAILTTMEKQRIKGGIDAVDSILGSIPTRILELPDEQRKVIAVVVTVIEGFQQGLQKGLEKLS